MKTKGMVLGGFLILSAISFAFCASDDGVHGIDGKGNPTPYVVAEAAFSGNAGRADGHAGACGTHSGCACDCGCFEPYWLAGVESTFMHVDSLPGGRLTYQMDDTGTVGVDLLISDNTGFQDNTAAPRVYLGRQITENWSIITRYWHLDAFDYATPTSPAGQVNLPNFLTITEIDHVKLYNFDIEAMHSACHGCWKLDGTVGARHSSFFSDATYSAFGVFTPGNFVQTLHQNHTGFDGTGLTGSLTARRQIGNSCASLFMSSRASHAWGLADGQGRVAGSIADSPSAPLIGAATVTRNNAEGQLAIGELQFGIQWERRLKCLPANAFFRTAFEYQYWRLNMPPIGGVGFGGTIGNLSSSTFMSAAEGRAELYGLALAAGLTW